MSVKIISKDGCAYCEKAKDLLSEVGVPYLEVDATPVDSEVRTWFYKQGLKTFPQIWDGGKHIGGYDQLCDYVIEQELV